MKKAWTFAHAFLLNNPIAMTLPMLARFTKYYVFFAALCPAFFSCENTAPTTKQANRQDPPTYEELAHPNAAAWLNQQGDSVVDLSDYRTAIIFYRQSMDSAAAQADSFLYYDSQLDLANVHDRLGDTLMAIGLTEPVVEAFVRSGDSSRIGRAYAALAGYYGKAGMTKKSMEASQKGFVILKNYGSLIERCAAYNQMAFTHSDEGNWAAAMPLLDTALQLMLASGALNQRPGMHLNVGDCHRRLGHWAEARRYLEAAAAEADSLGQAHILARAYERLSQLDEATGNPASALKLFLQAKAIRDSLFTAEKTRNLQELTVQYETREKEQEIRLLKANEQLQQTQRNLLMATLAFVVAILGFGLYTQRLKLRNTRQTLAQTQQEMADYIDILRTKNAQLSALEKDLQPGLHGSVQPEPDPANGEPDADPTETLYNNRILTDKEWEQFKYRFERLHPGYLLRLRTRYPGLSGAEERLFLLIKVNLNSQEIADILGITANGVKKGRQRLRKRLELAPDADLEAFVREV
ncbi:MAG: tetratricopeptide repeat protein [Saprospiraceae bacterium]